MSIIVVEVVDQGPGIPDEFLTTIFKPFFRLDKSRSADGISFGLGLSSAQRQLAAVRANVKAFNVESTGLKIIVTIPRK